MTSVSGLGPTNKSLVHQDPTDTKLLMTQETLCLLPVSHLLPLLQFRETLIGGNLYFNNNHQN